MAEKITASWFNNIIYDINRQQMNTYNKQITLLTPRNKFIIILFLLVSVDKGHYWIGKIN